MSTVVKCSADDFRGVAEIISTLIPAGDKEVPLGFHIRNGEIHVTCMQGIVYQGCISTDFTGAYAGTYLYIDILPLLKSGHGMTFEFDDNKCTVTTAGCLFEMATGYSVIQDITADYSRAQDVNPFCLSGIDKIVKLRLEKLYSSPAPVEIAGSLCIQQYPNTIVQSRVQDVPVKVLLDMRYLLLLSKFHGEKWDTSNPNQLTAYTKNGSILSVPCRQSTSSFKMTDMLQDMKVVSKLNVGDYADRLRTIMRIYAKTTCRVALYDDGIMTTIQTASSKVACSIGKCTSLVAVTNMPLEVWIAFLNVYKDSTVEVLSGGGKICLRDQELIILTCTLP